MKDNIQISKEDKITKLSPFMSNLIWEIDSIFKTGDGCGNKSYLNRREVEKYSSLIRGGLYILTLCGTTCSTLLVSRNISYPLYVIPIPIIGIALLYQISKWEIKEASNER